MCFDFIALLRGRVINIIIANLCAKHLVKCHFLFVCGMSEYFEQCPRKCGRWPFIFTSFGPTSAVDLGHFPSRFMAFKQMRVYVGIKVANVI